MELTPFFTLQGYKSSGEMKPDFTAIEWRTHLDILSKKTHEELQQMLSISNPNGRPSSGGARLERPKSAKYGRATSATKRQAKSTSDNAQYARPSSPSVAKLRNQVQLSRHSEALNVYGISNIPSSRFLLSLPPSSRFCFKYLEMARKQKKKRF